MPLWLTEADVVSLMDMGDAIHALEDGLRREAQGNAENMQKTHVAWSGVGTLHAIGAVFPAAGFAGTKTWAHTPGGATPLFLLFDSASGRLRGIIEAFALGQLRTGAASGCATRWLASSDADELAMIGTGKQALAQVAAGLAVRPVRRVRVFGRNGDRRSSFATRVRDLFGVEVVETADIAEAVRGAAIVTVATRASEPFLTSAMVATGAHINAIGAIVPSGAEVTADVIARCTQIVADSPAQARRLSTELIAVFGNDEARWNTVLSLATIVGSETRRSPDADLTLFKSLGMGIADLSLGIELYHRALHRGVGRAFEHPERVEPRLYAPIGSAQLKGG